MRDEHAKTVGYKHTEARTGASPWVWTLDVFCLYAAFTASTYIACSDMYVHTTYPDKYSRWEIWEGPPQIGRAHV